MAPGPVSGPGGWGSLHCQRPLRWLSVLAGENQPHPYATGPEQPRRNRVNARVQLPKVAIELDGVDVDPIAMPVRRKLLVSDRGEDVRAGNAENPRCLRDGVELLPSYVRHAATLQAGRAVRVRRAARRPPKRDMKLGCYGNVCESLSLGNFC